MTVKLSMELTDDQAEALAQMCKRICFEPHIVGLSDPWDGKKEAYSMRDGIIALQCALREAGFSPR